MRSRLLALMLLPLLWVQGRQVRRRTPRLPEAGGKRQGKCGDGPPLTLWIVGDSAAAGVGVKTQAEALSGQLTALLQPRNEVCWQCHATTGHCAADTATRLSELPAENVDVMVCSVGVNDAVGLRSVRCWVRAIEQIHHLATARFGVRLLVFSQIPPMQAFPALPVPLNRVLGMHARLLNTALEAYAEDNHDILVLAPPKRDVATMMASDGFHPGVAGYRQWAVALADALRVHVAQQNNWITDTADLNQSGPTTKQ